MPDAWNFTPSPRRAGPAVTTPYLTYLLCALSVLITVAHNYPGALPGPFWLRLGAFGEADPDDLAAGRLWGLVTTVFIHGDWLHLLFNMIWLVQLGRILELTLSPLIYPAFLIAAAAVGSACELLVSGTTGIGMSGVVYAMFALMWAGRGMYPVWGAVATRPNLNVFIAWGLFCLAATWLRLLNVANGAHAGGFLFGLCIGFLFFVPRRRWVWAAPLALLLGASAFAVARLHYA
jgi:GlpG protein